MLSKPLNWKTNCFSMTFTSQINWLMIYSLKWYSLWESESCREKYSLLRHCFSLLKWYRSLERGKCQSYSCLVVHTALKVFDACLWYLDSGCSWHMTGEKTLFKHLKEMKDEFVMFGDGSCSQILGKGSIEIPGFPILKEVLYIDGLKANLLSISQLCDDNYLV